MRPDDAVRIRHMISAARTIQEFIAGRQRRDLDTDAMLLFAVVRAIEIIGEAAARVSHETRESLEAVPWVAIVGMRNRLIHAYFDVDADMVWNTATQEIPALISSLPTLPPKTR